MPDETPDRDSGIWGWAILVAGVFCIIIGIIMCSVWIVVSKLV